MQSDWFPSHLLIFLKDTESMRCICLHSLPQAFSDRISPSAACFLFTASNRKTRFPAFSIPNELVLRGGGGTIPSESTLRLHKMQEKQKLVHSFPKYSIGRQPRTTPVQWFNILSLPADGKDRKNYKVTSPGSPKSALLVLVCSGHPPWHHLSQKEKTLPLSDKPPH